MSVIFKPIRGDSGRLNDQPIQDGVMWFAKDTGKLYIDTEEQRHPINPDMVLVDTTANWAAQSGRESEFGKIYVYTDYRQYEDESGNVHDVPGFKIGDGKAYLIDLPFAESNDDVLLAHIGDTNVHITQKERTVWNNKVRVFVSAADSENMVFTTD